MTENDRGGVGGGGAEGWLLTAARPFAPPGGNSNRVEFPSEDINYSFHGVRNKMKKGKMTYNNYWGV